MKMKKRCQIYPTEKRNALFFRELYFQRRRKEDEAAGAAYQTGHCKTVEPTHNSPHHFQAFLGKILILPTCRILINSICLFLKEPRKPSFDKGRGLNRSKFQMYTRKVLEKGTSCPRVAPAPSGRLRCPCLFYRICFCNVLAKKLCCF